MVAVRRPAEVDHRSCDEIRPVDCERESRTSSRGTVRRNGGDRGSLVERAEACSFVLLPPQLARPDIANNKKRAHIVREKPLPFIKDLHISDC